jgi:hypothetical protein
VRAGAVGISLSRDALLREHRREQVASRKWARDGPAKRRAASALLCSRLPVAPGATRLELAVVLTALSEPSAAIDGNAADDLATRYGALLEA